MLQQAFNVFVVILLAIYYKPILNFLSDSSRIKDEAENLKNIAIVVMKNPLTLAWMSFKFGLFIFLYIYRQTVIKKKIQSYPKDTVILHQFPRSLAYKCPSPSPFSLKLETWLKMANIPYQNEFGFKFSKKNKIPWITLNGVEYSDSQFIIEFLSKRFKVNMAGNSSKSIARAFLKTTEESLFWCYELQRFVYSSLEETRRSCGFPALFVFVTRNKMKQFTYCQGYGRHTEQEVYEIAKKDLQAIENQLSLNQFLNGKDLCDEDAGVFGLMAIFVYQDCGAISKFIKDKCPNIIRYVDKIKNDVWKEDWEKNIIHKYTNTFILLKEYAQSLLLG